MTEPAEPPIWPTSDPATWVPVPPNTLIACAALLAAVADRYEVNGWPADADLAADLAGRLNRHLIKWAEGRIQPPHRSEP